MYFENLDLETVVTPVNADCLEQLLVQLKYDREKTAFLVQGFKNSFSLGYQGKKDVRRTTPNLKLRIGNETILWNKVMKEVKLGRYVGPFKKISFDSYIQSPIGLVPKDGGKQTRLIFHLSYPRSGKEKVSINACTPPELCKVKYCDFDMAIRRCLEKGRSCSLLKSDFQSAFRNLGILRKH